MVAKMGYDPLEVIPFPEGLTPGTKQFLQAFRATATVREQWWIRCLNTGYPNGLNLEVHAGNPMTKQRRAARESQWQKPPPKAVARANKTLVEKSAKPFFWMDENGLHFLREEGHSSKIRSLLADFSNLETDDERHKFVRRLPRYQQNKMLNWLALNMPSERTSQCVFQQLAVQITEAQRSSTHASQQIFQTYDATSTQAQAERQEKRDKAAGNFWIKVPWRRNEMQPLGMHTLLNKKDIQNLYPISTEHGKVKVSYNLAVPIGVMLQNYGKAARDPEIFANDPPEVPPPETCPCHRYRTEGSIDFHRHVATVDPAFIRNERLKSFWLKGRKFRCQAHPQQVVEGFSKGLDNFITSAAKRNRVDEDAFQPWRQKLLEVLQGKCEVMFANENAPYHHFLCKDGFDELHKIQRDMVVTYVDKSSHYFALL